MATSQAETTAALLAPHRDDPAEYATIGEPVKAMTAWNRLNRSLTRKMPADLRRGGLALTRIRRVR